MPYSESIGVKGNGELDFSKVTYEVGQYDLNAVELAAQLSAANNGEFAVLTANGEVVSNSKMKKAILSRGAKEMFGIQDEVFENADSFRTAQALAAGVNKIGGVDLVICGEGSGDQYAQQVGNILGGLLGWPTVNCVSAAAVEDGVLKLERSIDACTEILEVELPAVISVTADINTPRIPTMRDILGAGKKPATVWSVADVALESVAASETLELAAPKQAERRNMVVALSDEEAIAEIAAQIKKTMQ